MVKAKQKILFIVTQSEFGGAQRYIFDLTTNLDPEKYSIAVAAGGASSFTKNLFDRLKNSSHIQLRRLKYLRRSINPFFDIAALFELKNLIAKEKPDIIHLNSTKAGVLGSLAAKLLNAKRYTLNPKVIYTAHGWTFNEPLPWLLKKIYLLAEKWTARFKDKIICVSEFDRQIALKYKIAPADKLITIHNGVNLKNLEFLPEKEVINIINSKFKIRDSKFIIGTIANLYPTKGLKYLIEAIKILNTKYNIQNTNFLIIGEGKERKNLEFRIKNLELENKVFLAGAISNAYKYLKAFDIFVLPSVKEGFPYVILEAMAAGLPIVATTVGGIPEIVEDGVRGFLIKPKNPGALAEKINILLENPDLIQKFSQNNLEKIKEFGLEKMLEKTEEQY